MNCLKSLLVVILLATISGCSSTADDIVEQEKNTALLNSRFTQSESKIVALTKRFEQAKADNLGYYAPDDYEEALGNYRQAKEEFDDILADRTEATQHKTDEISDLVLESTRALDSANQTKENVETIMVESFDIKAQLQKLHASKLQPKTYDDLMSDIDDIVEDIADGDLEDARADNAKLLPKLRAFEVRIVKMVELESAVNSLKQLQKAGSHRTTAISYQKSVSAIRAAESIIALNARDKSTIRKAVKSAEFEVNHTKHIFAAVKTLSAMSRSQYEGYLLTTENQLLGVSKALADADYRNKSIAEQAAKITDIANATQLKIKQQRTDIDALQASISAGNKEGAALLATAKQEKLSLEQQIMAQKQSIEALQDTITSNQNSMLNLQKTNFEKDQQLLKLEREKLSLESQVSKLVAQVDALGKPENAAKPRISDPTIDSTQVDDADPQGFQRARLQLPAAPVSTNTEQTVSSKETEVETSTE